MLLKLSPVRYLARPRFNTMAPKTVSSSTTNPKSRDRTLALFKTLTEKVYGPLPAESTPPSSLLDWTPPSTPGAGGHHGRYLWTDAFGLINLITLSHESSSPVYLTLARRLALTVHSVLGRLRDLSAPLPLATPEHPLAGGLRIGKLQDEGEGMEGDGQYHHYLTLWMFALNRLALATGEGKWNRLAVDLGRAVHPFFVVRNGKGKPTRMVWKVSMDLRRVLVSSEGHLDAVTGWVVFRLVQRAAEGGSGSDGEGGKGALNEEIEDYRELVMGREGKRHLTVSSDPLDLGMGLWMCHFFKDQEEWASKFGKDGLDVARQLLVERSGLMRRSASSRLAFREFGTCMGLECYGMDAWLGTRVEAVLDFWERYLDDSTEDDLRPISLVMFASALIPGAFGNGYLGPE